MTEDPGRETRIINIKERQIVVRQLTDAQYGLLVREAMAVKKAAAERNKDQVMRSTSLLMRTLAAGVVQLEDREWLDDLVADGELDMQDLLGVLRAFSDETQPAKPQVRRGRPAKRS